MKIILIVAITVVGTAGLRAGENLFVHTTWRFLDDPPMYQRELPKPTPITWRVVDDTKPLTAPPGINWKNGKARVQAFRGSAHFKRGAEKRPLEPQLSLRAGDKISTGEKSHVDFWLGYNGPIIRLLPNAEMEFGDLLYDDRDTNTTVRTRLILHLGSLLGSVRKTQRLPNYVVEIPGAQVRVHEGYYLVDAKGLFLNFRGEFEVFDLKTGLSSGPIETGQAVDLAVNSIRSMTRKEYDKFGVCRGLPEEIPPHLIYGYWPGRDFN